ncbi:MAG: TonB-dependent receptor [Exilibacterium sp.]
MTFKANSIQKFRDQLLATASALMICSSGAALAVDDTRPVSLAAQDMKTSLEAIAQERGVSVIARSDFLAGKTVPAISGNYSTNKLLQKLLRGSGLAYEIDETGNIYIRLSAHQMGSFSDTGSGANNSSNVKEDSSNVEEDAKFVLEEIVVTATRREASMQDIPIAISAFSGERLSKSGVEDMFDMQFLVAGMQIGDLAGQTRIALRGINTDNQEIGAESGVAVHLDDVFIAQITSLGGTFFDVERLEVLKGPQGTLYGRNATGGAINIVTKAPTDELDFGAKVTLGNYYHTQAEGFISGPVLGDSLTARIAFTSLKRDGFTKQSFYPDQAVNNADFSAVRAKLRYQPGDSFKFDLTADFSRDTGVPRGEIMKTPGTAPNLGELFGGTISSTSGVINDNYPHYSEKIEWGIAGRAEWYMDGMTLTSLTSYRDPIFHFGLEIDGTEVAATELIETRDFNQFSQSLHLQSVNDSALEWIVGASYFYQSANDFVDVSFPVSGIRLIIDTPVVDTTAYAAFAEASYDLLENLTLTIGARYNHEKKNVEGTSYTNDVVTSTVLLDASWNSFTPKASLAYHLSDTSMAYATVSRGFKAGGANLLNAYDPENVTNYEIGLKTQMFDNRLRTNINVFFMDYKDLQVQTVQKIAGIDRPIVTNAASAEIKGMELEFEFHPANSFSIDGNFSYLDATYKDFIATDTFNNNAPVDVSGNRMTVAPKFAVNVGAQYGVPVGERGTVTLRGEYSFKDDVFFSPQNDELRKQKAYHLLNARLTFEDADRQWNVSLYGKNLTDKWVANSITADASTQTLYPVMPRTYGISVGYNF